MKYTIMELITDFTPIEKLLLPNGCCFADDARNVINSWDSNDILYINHHVRQVVYLCHMGTASYLQQTQTRRHKLILQWKNAK